MADTCGVGISELVISAAFFKRHSRKLIVWGDAATATLTEVEINLNGPTLLLLLAHQIWTRI